jgi:hypothetical protein
MAALHDGSACCSFKRSRNDALSDESDGKSYCGTCWQSWVMASCKANALKTRATLPGSLGQSPVLKMFYEDDETVGFLEGAVVRNASIFSLGSVDSYSTLVGQNRAFCDA